MKQTYLAVALALLVSLVPVGFISQTASAISLDVDLQNVAENATKDVATVVDNGKSATVRAVNSVTNNGNSGQGNNGNHGQGNNGNGRGNGSENSDNQSAVMPEDRFTANQLRVCEKRQDRIMTQISSISDRGSKQLEVFHSIAERVKAFYVTKGYHTDSYDATAQQADTLYDQSLVALNATESNGEAWSCNGTNPIAQLQTFKQAKESEMAILAAYKDAVHELIITVKTAASQGVSQSTGGSE